LICGPRIGSLGSPIPVWRRPFSRACRFSSVRRPPLTCVNGFILSCASLLFRVSRAGPAARLPTLDASRGVASLFAVSADGVHMRGHPRPAKFRPRRFSRPRRLAPPPTFAGLFHPATTSRVRSPRVSPVTTAVRARRPPLPSCSLARPSCRRLPDGAGRTHPLSRALLRDAGPLHGTGV
jgi:hypothetical protein